ncbi:hypothetical protein DV735_g1002, partial [Chaetothyriales sp. CBS 134920]
MRAALPWALDLFAQQLRRRFLVRDMAVLMADAGTGEKVGKHRKLVAIATGLKEDELDPMSEELLENRDRAVPVPPHTPLPSNPNRPHTPLVARA